MCISLWWKRKALAALDNAQIQFGNLGAPKYNADKDSVRVVNARTSETTVTINLQGAFFHREFNYFDKNHQAKTAILDFNTGYSGAKLRAVILLHELGHLVGKFGPDGGEGNEDKNLGYTKQVLDACF